MSPPAAPGRSLLMTPRKTLQHLCNQHELPISKGEKLLPLVERALGAPKDVQERILSLVSRTLKREAHRYRSSRKQLDLDDRMLGVVAKVVHGWSPPEWLNVWSEDDIKGDQDDEENRDIA